MYKQLFGGQTIKTKNLCIFVSFMLQLVPGFQGDHHPADFQEKRNSRVARVVLWSEVFQSHHGFSRALMWAHQVKSWQTLTALTPRYPAAVETKKTEYTGEWVPHGWMLGFGKVMFYGYNVIETFFCDISSGIQALPFLHAHIQSPLKNFQHKFESAAVEFIAETH